VKIHYLYEIAVLSRFNRSSTLAIYLYTIHFDIILTCLQYL